MVDHFLAYFADVAEVCDDESAATKAVLNGALYVAKVCPSDGIWRDVTMDLAEAWWAANAHDKFDAIPKGFDPFIPQSEVAKYL